MANAQSDTQRDAVDMLMQDHKRVQKLFKDFEKLKRDDEETLRELVVTACIELQIHAMLEEEIFYPAVRAQPEAGEREDSLNVAEVEHESADDLIEKLHQLDADDAMYTAYFKVLADQVKHHIREEEKALFPAVRQMAGLDLVQLGEDMRRRRDELFAEMESEEDETDGAREESASDTDIAAVAEAAEDEEFEGEDEQEALNVSRTRH